MKAEIIPRGIYWQWVVCYKNGLVAVKSHGYYTRRDNAIRGLRNFIRKTVRATICEGELYELYCGVK